MNPELRKLNELLFKKKSKHDVWLTFRKTIIIALIIIVPLCLILFTPILERKEIIIVSQGEKTIINLGHLGSAFSSSLKNKERVNLLFLGIPGQGYPAPELTDTIIIINSTPQSENPVAISIPRDLFVKFPNQGHYTKINTIYEEEGIEAIKKTIKEITDLDIDYFIVLDLEGVKKLVDQFDGIDVVNENDIYDPEFPASNNSYEIFSLNKGIHHLDGISALKYIRSRHEPGGDFARIKRQQQVINILKDKILSLNPIWNFPSVLNVWKTLNEHTHTNIGLSDIKYAWNLAKKTNLDEIEFITLSNQPGEEIQLLISDNIILGEKQAYILKPRTGIGNYEEIKEYIANLVDQD